MRAGIVVSVTPEDWLRLEGVVRDRNSPQKHVARALALIATAEGCGGGDDIWSAPGYRITASDLGSGYP